MDEPGDQANIDQDYFGILSAQGRLPMLESFTAQRMTGSGWRWAGASIILSALLPADVLCALLLAVVAVII
jgi:hypothetical protein